MQLPKSSRALFKLVLDPLLLSFLWLGAFAILHLPNSRFDSDDFIQLAVLSEAVEYPHLGPFNLYSFLDGNREHLQPMLDEGPLPWFTCDTVQISFLRPLASTLLAVDQSLFGLEPIGYFLHSLAWYMVLVVLVALLAREVEAETQISGPLQVSFFAVTIFTVAPSHWIVVTWAAGRWLVVAAVLAVAGMIAYTRAKKWRYLLRQAAILPLFGLSLLAGEASVALLAYFVSFVLIAERRPWRNRIAEVLPTAVLVLAYTSLRSLAGYGVAGQDFYIDPFKSPLHLLSVAPSRILALFRELIVGWTAFEWLDPERRLAVTLGGFVSVVVICLLLLPAWRAGDSRRRRTIEALLVGTLGSMVPLACRLPSGHVLLIPGIGFSMMLGIAFSYWSGRMWARRTLLVYMGTGLCLLAIYLYLIRPLQHWIVSSRDAGQSFQYLKGQYENEAFDELGPGQKAVFLHSDRFEIPFHAFYYRKLYQLPMPSSWWSLSTSPHQHHFLRTGESEIELQVIGGRLLDTPMETGIRGRGCVLKSGDSVQLDGLEIIVLEGDENGLARVRFSFEESLDSSVYHFYVYRQGRLERLAAPRVGGVFELG